MYTKTLQTEIDESVPKHTLSVIQSEMAAFGYDVSILEDCQWSNGHPDLASNTGITPKWVTGENDLSERIRTGIDFPFTLERELDGYFGKSEGSANVTTLFQKFELSLEEVLEKLESTGQIEQTIKNVAIHCPDHVKAENVVAFAIATYAKGWLAEKILTTDDRFKKGSVAQDKGGMDVYDTENDDWCSVKSVTKAQGDHLFYQWDCRGGIHFGDDHKQVNKDAGAVSERVVPYTGEITPTETLRTVKSNKADGHRYRYLWW